MPPSAPAGVFSSVVSDESCKASQPPTSDESKASDSGSPHCKLMRERDELEHCVNIQIWPLLPITHSLIDEKNDGSLSRYGLEQFAEESAHGLLVRVDGIDIGQCSIRKKIYHGWHVLGKNR